MKSFYVYIVTNKKYGIPYTGITNDLGFRTCQHKNKLVKGFTSRYNLDKLVWYEEFDNVRDAIAREKQIKGWTRQKKLVLIDSFNPEWIDLYPFIIWETDVKKSSVVMFVTRRAYVKKAPIILNKPRAFRGAVPQRDGNMKKDTLYGYLSFISLIVK